MENNWVSIDDKMPEFTHNSAVRGGEKTTEMIDVKFDDGSEGEGVFRDNPWRSSWMTRDDSEGFLFNQVWGGKHVTHWKPKE